MYFTSVVYFIILSDVLSEHHCRRSLGTQCPHAFFILKGMFECHPWLTCGEIRSIKIKHRVGSGTVKSVYVGSWNSYQVAISKLNNPILRYDFQSGLSFLKSLTANLCIIQLVGYCDDEDVIVTEYHQFGSAVDITERLNSISIGDLNSRLNLCLNYVQILDFIHNGLENPRVACDSNDLYKLLSQFLVTDELRLILNDVDALPEVRPNASIKCGQRELHGRFVAPEQLWKLEGRFSDELIPGYNEKTDIWKVPYVCDHFVAGAKGLEVAQYALFELHKPCQSFEPHRRPTAHYLIQQYQLILMSFKHAEFL